MMENNVLVIGGGPAGSMVALELARADRMVSLLEKSRGPHDKVCGDFLSEDSLLYLDRHGLDVRSLGAVPIRHIHLVTRSGTARAALPFQAFSLSRRKLDEELLRIAAGAGVEVHRDVCVEKLEQVQEHWRAELRSGGFIEGSNTFLATGKHDLRGWGRPAGMQRGLIAFKMYYRLAATQYEALGDAVELVLFPGGYAGLQPMGEGCVNLCLLVSAKRLRELGGGWGALLRHILDHAPHLLMRLQGASPQLSAPLSAFHIPYGYMQGEVEKGLWRVGDQAAVIPSFCGDGVAIALHSGALAASHFLKRSSSRAYRRELSTQLASRVWMATGISQMLVRFPQAASLARIFPGLLSGIAAMTRIPRRALITSRGMEGI